LRRGGEEGRKGEMERGKFPDLKCTIMLTNGWCNLEIAGSATMTVYTGTVYGYLV